MGAWLTSIQCDCSQSAGLSAQLSSWAVGTVIEETLHTAHTQVRSRSHSGLWLSALLYSQSDRRPQVIPPLPCLLTYSLHTCRRAALHLPLLSRLQLTWASSDLGCTRMISPPRPRRGSGLCSEELLLCALVLVLLRGPSWRFLHWWTGPEGPWLKSGGGCWGRAGWQGSGSPWSLSCLCFRGARSGERGPSEELKWAPLRVLIRVPDGPDLIQR